ncbi:MAG: ribosomal protein S18-alanine N-acetyltransferase [Clostridiales bacterium]|nr:ribosomal protein S18-alanine N-acetyltransferase [Clostridiales bacterium]
MERQILPMTVHDIKGVAGIEEMCFHVPWSRESLRIEVEQNRCARYFVVKEDEHILGYGGMWLVLDEAHITNIAVHPDYRRQGIGGQIINTLMKTAIKAGIERMTLEVRVSNHPAIALYKSFGFEEGGIRKGYYANNKEDALIMWNIHIGGYFDENQDIS